MTISPRERIVAERSEGVGDGVGDGDGDGVGVTVGLGVGVISTTMGVGSGAVTSDPLTRWMMISAPTTNSATSNTAMMMIPSGRTT